MMHSQTNPLRFVEVPDDHLEPEIRRRDYMLLANADDYIGEGYYLTRWPFADEESFAAYHCSGGGSCAAPLVRLVCLNKTYRGRADLLLSREEFARVVVGKAVMTCKVQDHALLPSLEASR